MAYQEQLMRLGIRAEKSGTAIGSLYVRDIQNGNVIVGNENIINIYKFSEEDASLSTIQIETGLKRLREILPERAPILQEIFTATATRLRAGLVADIHELSPHLQKQREEQLDIVQLMCMEVTDITFRALCNGKKLPPYDPRSPFRGLESFRPEDQEFFFGRENLTNKLVKRLQAERFLALLGASGCGKSSLVMAGLVPALNVNSSVFRPGENMLELLETAGAYPLIVIDQFEELFTVIRDEEIRSAFISRLLETINRSMVVVTMRADFLGEVSRYPLLSEQIQRHLEIISPMNTDELRCAMDGQAKKMGLRFEADLSQQMLEAVEGEPGAMPLLQHTLWELWKRRHGYHLRASEYRAFGGAKKAIAKTAEQVYGECTKAEQEHIRYIFLRLTHFDDQADGRDTRRRISLSDLVGAGPNSDQLTLIIDKLATARLIVKTPGTRETEVEVAHEALIKQWERLRTWINDNRGKLLLGQQLTEAADNWNTGGRDASDLYRGKNLSWALQLAKSPVLEIGPLEQEFLDVCVSNARRAVLYRGLSLLGVTLITVVLISSLTGILPRMIYQPPTIPVVNIPAGDFSMGSDDSLFKNEKPAHPVYVKEFAIGIYEVTNEEYLTCVKARVCAGPKNEHYGLEEYANHPVTNVTWTDAVTFCQWIDRRLPTEAEWEKAARGTEELTYPWGEQINRGDTNYKSNGTAPVGIYPKDVSPYGVYDMSGNVWEWVANQHYEYTSSRQTDEFLPELLEQEEDLPRIIRGGSWGTNAYSARLTYRNFLASNLNADHGGFRCAQDVSP